MKPHVKKYSKTKEALQAAFKELSDIKSALDESAIVAITDQTGIIIYANNQFCELSKYPKKELIGQDHRIINSGYHPKKFMRDLWSVISKGNVWKGEIRNKAKDGSYYWVDTTIVPFFDDKGNPYQYVAIRHDITKRKEIEIELRSERDKAKKYFDVANVMMLVLNKNGEVININKRATELLGYSENQILGKNWFDHFLPEDNKEKTKTIFQEIMAGKIQVNEFYENVVRTKSGKEKLIAWHNTILNDKDKRMIGVISSGQDITEAKKSEELIKEIPQKIIQAQDTERNRISRDIHDDLGQSLIALKMNIYAVAMDNTADANVIKKACKESMSYLDSIIEKTRHIAHRLRPTTISSIGLSASLDNLVEQLKQKDKKILIKLRHGPIDSLQFEAESINLYRIVQEALANIFKHARASRVDIQMKRQKNRLSVVIKDNGRGYRRKKGKEIGLGLLTMRERAKMLKAKFNISSSPKEGTSIHLDIPIKMKGKENG